MKYILVSGGVVSGIGKGITASSIGVLMKSCGWRITHIKIDPYVNIDAGTMSPYEHGETYVLDDGGEVDLDLGNYERFLDIHLTRDNNITTGKIYRNVIQKERDGGYGGKAVKMVPDLTDAVQEWIENVAKVPSDDSGETPDICVIELGGTVGDIENMPFIEAMRHLKLRIGAENFCSVYVSLIPCLGVVGEQKTKPTQHGVKELRMLGMAPDLLACRGEKPLLEATREKLGLHCQVPPSHVISVHDVSNIMRVPLLMHEQGVTNMLIKKLQLVWQIPKRLTVWGVIAQRIDNCTESITIALVGKYNGLTDSYLSVGKSLVHASVAVNRKLKIEWVSAEDLAPPKEGAAAVPEPEGKEPAWDVIKRCDGILLPGGFGTRGVEGKVACANYARLNNKPILGICLGFQCMTIEAGRNLAGLENANSTEFDKDTANPVVIFMPEGSKTKMGGTMRLGQRVTCIRKDSVCRVLYADRAEVYERHRHRYEVNPEMVSTLEAAGLEYTGRDDTGERMHCCELKGHATPGGHPFYMGVQYHPEFQSRPGRPSPPFLGLLLAASGNLERFLEGGAGRAEFTIDNPWAATDAFA